MSVKQTFTCDICGCEFSNRNGQGQAMAVGGVNGGTIIEIETSEGIKERGELQVVNMDFCEEHFQEIINFIAVKQNEHTKA